MSRASSLTEAVKQAAVQTTSLTDAVKEAARSDGDSTVVEFPRAAPDRPHRGPVLRLVATAPHIEAPAPVHFDEPLPDAAPDAQRPSRPLVGRPLAKPLRKFRLPALPSLGRDALSRWRAAIHNLIRVVTRAALKAAAVLLLCFFSMVVAPSRVASDRPPAPALEHRALTGRSHFNPSTDAAAVKPAPDARAREAAEAWRAAKATRSRRVLEAFIARYGDTFYSELARARLAELRKRSRPFGK
jgi:hypothetical protein